MQGLVSHAVFVSTYKDVYGTSDVSVQTEVLVVLVTCVLAYFLTVVECLVPTELNLVSRISGVLNADLRVRHGLELGLRLHITLDLGSVDGAGDDGNGRVSLRLKFGLVVCVGLICCQLMHELYCSDSYLRRVSRACIFNCSFNGLGVLDNGSDRNDDGLRGCVSGGLLIDTCLGKNLCNTVNCAHSLQRCLPYQKNRKSPQQDGYMMGFLPSNECRMGIPRSNECTMGFPQSSACTMGSPRNNGYTKVPPQSNGCMMVSPPQSSSVQTNHPPEELQ